MRSRTELDGAARHVLAVALLAVRARQTARSTSTAPDARGPDGGDRARNGCASRPTRIWRPSEDPTSCDGRRRTVEAHRAARHGSRGSSGCFAGSPSRRACSSGSSARLLAGLLAVYIVRTVRARLAPRTARSIRRADARAGISTSARRAFPPTSALRRARSGIAASTVRRSRCSTEGCCRASRTFTACPSATRAPRATA